MKPQIHGLLLLILTKLSSSLVPQFSNIQNNVAYASYWENLLIQEHRETVEDLKERRKNWSRGRLEATGMSIFGAAAEPDSELFGDKIVRVYKHGESRLQDRFSRGDVLVLTPEVKIGGRDPVPRDCLVVDVGKDWLSVGVGPSWPLGLWEGRRTPGAYLVRLDRTAPQAPLKAQRTALDRLRKGKAGEAASTMVNLFENSGEYVDMTSQVPSHFESQGLEKNIWDALEKATEATSFEPNQSQKDAIVWALQRRISLIRGPPGTGKTRVAALLVSTALRLAMKAADDNNNDENEGPKPRVLAVTHSNGAADVLLEALLQMGVPAVRAGRPASVSPNFQHRTIVAIAEKMPEVRKLRQTASDVTLDSQSRSSAAFDAKRYVSDIREMIAKTAPVVVTSCIGAHQLLMNDESDVTFPIVVLDEAAQTTEPALMCALAAAKSQQVILVGDTRQLPPTVTSTELKDSIGVSPMARLESIGVGQKTLSEQYRMPASLLEHPSKYFYNGLVTCAKQGGQVEAPPPAGFLWPSPLPLAFVQTGNESEIAHNFGGKSNPTEVELVLKIVSDLIAAGDVEARNIAVITPYSKQVQLIRTELSNFRFNRNVENVRVGTVDSFQGQETDIVIFSAVRSNDMKELGFLRDSRRLNVAITRARRGLILVGDQKVLRTCRHWAALLESCEKRGCSMDAKDLDEEKNLILADDVNADKSAMSGLLDDSDEFYGLFSLTDLIN